MKIMSYKEMLKEAQDAGTVQSITPRFVEFVKKGEIIIGEFIGAHDIRSQLGDGEYKHYTFRTDDGLVKFAVGAATDKEIFFQLVPGQVYAVEYGGKTKLQGGREVNKFTWVHVRRPPERVGGPQDRQPGDE